MRSHRSLLTVVLATLITAPAAAQEPIRVASPDGRNEARLHSRDGRIYYSVQRDGNPVIAP